MEDITVLLSGGKSPSKEAMKRTFSRATLNGGVTQDFTANVENIRDVSRDLGYNILQDASFVYVPSSYGESKNFVQNPSIRNLVKFSEEFDNATAWNVVNATISPNATTAPDGTTTADKLVESSASSNHQVNTNKLNSTELWTCSVWMKAAGRNFGQIVLGGNLYAIFDLVNGIVTSVTANTTTSITPYPNGWFRCSVTAIPNSINLYIIPCINGTTNSYLGDGVSGIYIWGAQAEKGSTVTPYQRTTDGIADFTSTRATSSTATNKLGVIEDSCYNMIQQSETFDNAIWGKSEATISANVTIAPNGTVTADKLVESVNNSGHSISERSGTIAVIGTTYTFSCYIKAAGRNLVSLYPFTNGSGGIRFDVSNGTIVTTDPLTTAAIVNIGDGWYRCSVTRTAVSATFIDNYIYLQNPGTNYVGDGVSGVYIWGAELVAGTTPRPYLRTTNRLNVPKLDYSRSLSEPSLLIEPQSTNLLLNSATATTQNVTVTAVPYTLSAYGTGTYTLSGAYSGVFTASGTNSQRTVMTFTPSSGTLTLTAAGSMVMVQLE